ncbi:hypothetical protein CVO76_14360 [Arthrobacter agilis]|uniref:BON domain-containing protein n=1 Tax=Arthrobacter agilis TaxID=37921 RepID=A0A2L0UHH4_9MICC|nr:hypothetical protein CVO76_14360 [Arthrobacter agilis]
MTADQRAPDRRHHLQRERAGALTGRAAPAKISPDPLLAVTRKPRHTEQSVALSATTRNRRREAGADHHQESPNAALRLVVDRAAPHAKITIAERKGAVTLTGTAVTLAEKNRAGFACWAVRTTTAVYNDVTLTP